MQEIDDILGSPRLGKKKCSRCNKVTNSSYFVYEYETHWCRNASYEDSIFGSSSGYDKISVTYCSKCYKNDLLLLMDNINKQLYDIEGNKS